MNGIVASPVNQSPTDQIGATSERHEGPPLVEAPQTNKWQETFEEPREEVLNRFKWIKEIGAGRAIMAGGKQIGLLLRFKDLNPVNSRLVLVEQNGKIVSFKSYTGTSEEKTLFNEDSPIIMEGGTTLSILEQRFSSPATEKGGFGLEIAGSTMQEETSAATLSECAAALKQEVTKSKEATLNKLRASGDAFVKVFDENVPLSSGSPKPPLSL